MITLTIDTTNNTKTVISLLVDGKKDTIIKEVKARSSQETLPMIDEILAKHHVTLQDLTNIEVSAGPGSFTGTRVGVAIANALAFTLRIPVNGTSIEKGKTLVEPRY